MSASRFRPRPSLVALLLAAAACGREPVEPPSPTAEASSSGTPWFEECALERGLVFEHVSGHTERHLFPEIMGGGAALADLDADGDLDAYLVQSGDLGAPARSGPGNRLFANDGGGRFADVSEGSGADDRGYGMGVALGDANGDGRPDLYVTNVGPNALLANDGGARFTDVTASAGAGDPTWSVSAAFFDLENDGDLDLFVVDYVLWTLADELFCEQPTYGPDYCSPKAYRAPAPDVLYVNEGDGRFRDVSSEAGLRTAFGNGLGVVCADFDDDGWTDVFVANDGTMNQLWCNTGAGTFRDEAIVRGVAVDDHGVAKAGMGVAAADLDDDGDEDLLVVNLAKQTDSLYLNEGAYFSDRTALMGLATASRPYTRFGTGLFDLDCDGHLDLFQANGRVARAREPEVADAYAEPNLLLRGLANGRFEALGPRGGALPELVFTSRGAAFGDVDGDGAVDVVVVNRDAAAHLLRNVAPERGAWLVLRAVEADGADALGARVTARVGDRTLTRTVRSASSYASANDPAVYLGLGDAAQAEAVHVRWNDGAQEDFGSLAAGRVHRLERGSGTTLDR